MKPTYRLVVGFTASPSFAGYFVLNRSVLDGADVLAGATSPVDVSQWLTGQLSISRGRSRETDQHQAGTLTFVLRNEDRRFDPTNTASPYYPGIIPRAPVSLFIAGQQVFGGYVDDYDLGYLKPETATVTVSCIDAFTLLATTQLDAYSAPVEYSGQRIHDVLLRPEINFPATFNLDRGQSVLQASTQTAVAALDHCNTATASDGGLLFCDRFGVLQFKDRTFVTRQAVAYPNGQLVFSDVP